jgi:hypothetical protein
VKSLVPDSPARSEYPVSLGATIQVVTGYNARFHFALIQGIECNLTVFVNLKNQFLITAIELIEIRSYPLDSYKWELPSSIGERLLASVNDQLSLEPYDFHGELANIRAYDSQSTTNLNHNLIFQGGNNVVHSVVLVLHPTNQLTFEFWTTATPR